MDERNPPGGTGDEPPVLDELAEAALPPPNRAAEADTPPSPSRQRPAVDRPQRSRPVAAATTSDSAEGLSPADLLPPAWRELLENRLIMLGISGVVLLLLTVGILFTFSRDGGASGPTAIVGRPTGTPVPTSFPDTRLVGEALETTTMRNGPSRGFVPLGTIPQGARVPIVGRNEEATWLQVTYPSGSPLRGWVEAVFLDVSGDVSQLVIAGPGPQPSLDVPTSTFPTGTPTEEPAEPTDTPEPTEEPEPTEPPVATTPTPASAKPTPDEPPAAGDGNPA